MLSKAFKDTNSLEQSDHAPLEGLMLWEVKSWKLNSAIVSLNIMGVYNPKTARRLKENSLS